MSTTLIRNADWIIAWDDQLKSHTYLTNQDVVFKDNKFVQIGGTWDGEADQEIDGRGKMIMPGLVDIHSHPTSEPGNKGLLEELGSKRLGQSSLYEFMPVFRVPQEAAPLATKVAMGEMLQSGVTTIVDMSGSRENWANEVAETGIRGVLCPMYRSARWFTKDGHSVEYEWDEKAGEAAFEQALKTVDDARKHPSGRMDGMLGPSQLDTCTEGLIKDSLAEARKRNMRMQIHAAQSVIEFEVIMRRFGYTPIEYLAHLDALGPDTIIGHGIFLNDHPMLHWPAANDFETLAESGAHVAHCPTIFSRRGIALNTLDRYAKAGIRVGIGTDSFPHNQIEEMRHACLMSRVNTRNYLAGSTDQAFNAATVWGAEAIGRDDIGKLAVGMKADFSIVDTKHPLMRPCREPLRSLIYTAAERAVKDVYVDGQQVVRDGKAIYVDMDSALDQLEEFQRETVATVSERDWAGRQIEEMSPMVFPQK